MDAPMGDAPSERGRLRSFHEAHGAVFAAENGVEVVDHYGRPARTHRAVRKGVGVIDMPADVIVLEGGDRRDYLDNLVTATVPEADGTGCYALLLDPQGRIEADLHAYNAGERLLVFAPPGVAEPVVEGWETFIQDVTIRVATDDFAVFGVHGPTATEKVASVLAGAAAPDERHTFVRGSMGDDGVAVIRTDAPTGEPGFEVVCAAEAAPDVVDTLLTRGLNAVPFGRTTWRALTLEAGTPLFEAELSGRIPNVVGVRTAVDFEKGCFVGQEVVSKVENRGRPSRKLVGLVIDGTTPPDPGATVTADDGAVGEVTRSAESPSLDAPIAFAYVDFGFEPAGEVGVSVGAETAAASVEPLPLVDGTERSSRIPRYP